MRREAALKKGEKKKRERELKKRAQRKAARGVSAARGPRVSPHVRQARGYPLEGCWAQKGWEESGLAATAVARRQPDERLVYGVFLVDYYCLGVKDTFARADVPPARFHADFLARHMPGGQPVAIGADLAHELIYGAIEFAARFGFRPHPDFALTQFILDPPEAHPPTGKVEFGREGKPFYVSGPNDDVDAIIARLMRTAGPGNFHYLLHLGEPPIDYFGEAD